VTVTIKQNCDAGRPYRLENKLQHYAWGTRGDQAFIAHLLGLTPQGDQPFAELWMGVHPLAPSIVLDPQKGKTLLSDWIAEQAVNRLGPTACQKFPTGLPYLFKVLSADTALSLQAHPNRAQAQVLHNQDPLHYPDDNHKPEIAIAIDHLEALVGFKSDTAYQDTLEQTPELKQLINGEGRQSTLKPGVIKLLTLSQTDPPAVRSVINHLKARLQVLSSPDETEKLFLEQAEVYGDQDVGLLFLFLLERCYLGPGEAVYLPPGVPHAYLKGNLVECMANSDNVVRLGLTKKFCDVPALMEILSFEQRENFRVTAISDGYQIEYQTPTTEFLVKSLNLLQGESRAFSFRSSLTLYLLLDGEISLQWGVSNKSSCSCIYRRGEAFITPANLKQFTIQAKSHSKLYLVEIP